MPSLSVVQISVLESLLGRAQPDPALFLDTPAGFQAALAVHRETVLGGAANALRICFPTVDKLVGAAFFESACHAFVRAAAPASADLIAYADGFADFLSTYAPASSLAYLGDVARFDLALDRAGRSSADDWQSFAIDAHTSLRLSSSLRTLPLTYPADAIRAAVEQSDEVALAQIDLTPLSRWLAVWRTEAGVSARPLSPHAARFVSAILASGDVTMAACALVDCDEQDAMRVVEVEVFTAPFATIVSQETML